MGIYGTRIKYTNRGIWDIANLWNWSEVLKCEKAGCRKTQQV